MTSFVSIFYPLRWLVLALGLSACVTIHIYFPAAQAQQAADRIVNEILGAPVQTPTQAPVVPADEAGPTPAGAAPQVPAPQAPQTSGTDQAMLAWLWRGLVNEAQAAADFSVDSPEIRRLREQMKVRHERLAVYYDRGWLGFRADALLALPPGAAVPLKERSAVTRLLEAENADRLALYRAIAQANGHPEWEPQVRAVFADTWIRHARAGWWHQDSNSQWVRK